MTDRMTQPAHKRAVIAGAGMSEVGKVTGTAEEFAVAAINSALQDAGLGLGDVDGLLVSAGAMGGVSLDLAVTLGLRDLRLLSQLQAFGATATQMVQQAVLAVESGTATTVVCVWADDPIREAGREALYGSGIRPRSPWRAIHSAAGAVGANDLYAVATRRHMNRFGTTSEQLGHIAVAQREWAGLNPVAQKGDPITLADHAESRWISEPLRLLDCCLISNGAAAFVVTTADRASAGPHPAVEVRGWGQSHPGAYLQRNDDFGLVSGAARSGPAALDMARLALTDIDLVQLYDCYTFTVLLTLEDYGFCDKGEGGEFVASGVLGPGRSLALNTGGGQLSGYYLWGMTPLMEALTQVRGTAGQRQLAQHDTALVSGNGGIFSHHATLVLERAGS